MAVPIAKILTINQFLQLPKENLSAYKIQICGKIVTEIEKDSFCFADQETVIDCKITSQSHLSSRYLKKDTYIKIVKPGIARNPDRILVQATSIILPTRPLPFVDVSELLMLSEPFEEAEQPDEPISLDIATAQYLAPKQIVKKLV